MPYEVIYAGDGIHDADELEVEDLRQYPVIILPHVLALTENQENAILDYVNEGGIAVVYGDLGTVNEHQQEVARPSLNAILKDEVNSYGEGKIYYYPSQELGYEYYSYTISSPIAEEFGEAPDIKVTEKRADEIKKEFQELLNELIAEGQIGGSVPQEVFVQPYISGDKLYLHLINYDYEMTMDRINPIEGLSLRVRLPSDFVPGSIKLISPDLAQEVELEFSLEDDYVSFEVSELLFWDIVVMEG